MSIVNPIVALPSLSVALRRFREKPALALSQPLDILAVRAARADARLLRRRAEPDLEAGAVRFPVLQRGFSPAPQGHTPTAPARPATRSRSFPRAASPSASRAPAPPFSRRFRSWRTSNKDACRPASRTQASLTPFYAGIAARASAFPVPERAGAPRPKMSRILLRYEPVWLASALSSSALDSGLERVYAIRSHT